jgi:hypothetical protein
LLKAPGFVGVSKVEEIPFATKVKIGNINDDQIVKKP